MSEQQLEQLQEEEEQQLKRKRISYSELKIWEECSFRHKLQYIDGLATFTGNEYTAFGTALHKTCEEVVVDSQQDGFSIFKQSFASQIKKLNNTLQLNKKLVVEMVDQSKPIIENILPALQSHFGNYSVVSIEEQLFEDINDFETDMKFKGFIDLVIKTEDGQYHIIDWKTCSWGWKAEKKSQPMTVYQLSLYKKFFSEKHEIDPNKIETHFALLKRTAKKNNVEIFKVSNKSRRIANAISLLQKAISNINSKNFVKNRLSCNYCEFKNTPHCP